jgi:hypothetical protein
MKIFWLWIYKESLPSLSIRLRYELTHLLNPFKSPLWRLQLKELFARDLLIALKHSAEEVIRLDVIGIQT